MRLGSAACKLVRVIRFVRLIRIVKLYRYFRLVLAGKDKVTVLDPLMLPPPTQDPKAQAQAKAKGKDSEGSEVMDSRIGLALPANMIKRAFAVLMILMLSVPIFSYYTYLTDVKSFAAGLDLLSKFHSDPTGSAFKSVYASYLDYHRNLRTPLVLLKTPGGSFVDAGIAYTDLRVTEKEILYPENENVVDFYVSVFDTRMDSRMEALLGLCQTIYICGLTAIALFMISIDTKYAIIKPVERLLERLKKVAKQPLEAAKEAEDEELDRIRAAHAGQTIEQTNGCWVKVYTKSRSVATRKPSSTSLSRPSSRPAHSSRSDSGKRATRSTPKTSPVAYTKEA
jgi:hypothetical protein